MGKILDNYLKDHDIDDITILSLVGMGCVTLLNDQNTPSVVKSRLKRLEESAHNIVNVANFLAFPMKEGHTLDPDNKD